MITTLNFLELVVTGTDSYGFNKGGKGCHGTVKQRREWRKAIRSVSIV
jgi:hypothetical protein